MGMCSPEEAALLQLEEVFSATLARISNRVLQPLLTAEPSDPQGRECLRLLQQLHGCAQQLWEVTERSLRALRERLRHPDAIGLESLLLLLEADHVLQVHMEYIESYTSCVVVQAFQKAAKQRRYWRDQRKDLRQLLWGVSPKGSMGTALVQALRQPLTHHVQKYALLLLSLRDTIGECHPARELVVHAATLFGDLQSFMKQALDQAEATQALWHTLSSRLRDALCTPARRLLQDSQDVPVTVTPLRAERALLFDDVLVLLQGHSVHTFDLKLVWVDPEQDGCSVHLLTPEEEFFFGSKSPQDLVVWRHMVTQAVCQALRGKKDFPVLGAGLVSCETPTCRSGAYTFRAEGRLCQATYEGEWCRGRPHGKGALKWPDGQNHVGSFCQGLEHGFGICLVPQASEDKFDCYKCHWREGSMCGYGICEYGTGEVYKGYFQAGLRHGFGVLESTPQAPHPCKYTGHWERGQRSGYGIQEDGDRGERYIGMWQADQRHGPGLIVTQAGVCYQGTFQADKMVGPGTLLSEDDSLYEGTFTRDLTLLGKGKLTSYGFTLEGSFGSGAQRGLYTQGVLDMATLPPDPSSTCKRQLGLGAFPVESRWQGVYGPFRDFVRAGCPGDLQEALLGFHVQSLRESQEYLCCERIPLDDSVGRMEDILEEVAQHREPEALQQCLRKALSSSLHPLGKLLRTLMLTFQATYAGFGANKHLQGLAQEEVKQHARELWAAYRGLLQVALQRKGEAPEEEEDVETRWLPRPPGGLWVLSQASQEPAGARTGAASHAAQLLLGALHALPAASRERGPSLQPGHRQPEPLPRHPAAGAPGCAEAPVAPRGPHTDNQSETLPGVCHRVSAEDHHHSGPPGEAGGAGEDIRRDRGHGVPGAGPGAQAAHGRPAAAAHLRGVARPNPAPGSGAPPDPGHDGPQPHRRPVRLPAHGPRVLLPAHPEGRTTRIDCPPAGTPGSPGSLAYPGPGVVLSRPPGLPGCEQAQPGPRGPEQRAGWAL